MTSGGSDATRLNKALIGGFRGFGFFFHTDDIQPASAGEDIQLKAGGRIATAARIHCPIGCWKPRGCGASLRMILFLLVVLAALAAGLDGDLGVPLLALIGDVRADHAVLRQPPVSRVD